MLARANQPLFILPVSLSPQVQAEDGNIYPMRYHAVVNCAGPWAGEVARYSGIGIDDNFLRVPLPIEPRSVSRQASRDKKKLSFWNVSYLS